ncbi:MAG: HEAT repeat domain-containing protein [Verrucomicrobia bacterium]|jgi:HEAT repeat protein|nr:HEAT repeat domain-containing protein [Verrucomicrobiota bacterium]
MKTTFSLKTTFALLFALATFVFQAPAAEKSEAAAIAALSDKMESKVTAAMQEIEKKYPNSIEGVAKIKSMLGDERVKVRRKAARVVGTLHADVTEAELKQIAALLKGKTPEEIIDGLKALRGLKSQPVIPEIKALLDHPTPNVIRDACRTLSEIGGKDLIPAIEPLLNHANAAVKKDAQDAIFKLKNK